uniref:Uncharacterized protein n=1 Tax=viral metagenome TaxID=1070528 RepID=A0A6C0IWQ9_9ZZZZ
MNTNSFHLIFYIYNSFFFLNMKYIDEKIDIVISKH